jgi:hypothetical protein
MGMKKGAGLQVRQFSIKTLPKSKILADLRQAHLEAHQEETYINKAATRSRKERLKRLLF